MCRKTKYDEKRDKGQEKTPECNTDLKGCINNIFLLAQELLALAFLPLFLASCDNTDSGKNEGDEKISYNIDITKSSGTALNSLDIFYYNDDGQERLDSYQRYNYEESSGGTAYSNRVNGISTTGEKIIASIANFPESDYLWSDICSLSSLKNIRAELDNDDPENPVMSGMAKINAGKDFRGSMEQRPVRANVGVGAFNCDLHTRSYQGEKLKNVKVYLTNVCISWPILRDSLAQATEYMNLGRADSIALSALKHPEYLYKDLGISVGESIVRPDVTLLCYPNTSETESLGSPYTRLVIEGELQGNKYYYPLNVNRKENAEGIERNSIYYLDVTLTRRGTTDPDTAVDTDTAKISVEVSSWEEKDKQYVSY